MKLTGIILRPCSGQAPGVSLLLERNSSEAVPLFPRLKSLGFSA